MLGMIVVVTVVIMLAYFFTRYIVGSGWGRNTVFPQKSGGVSILAQTSVGKEQHLAIVQAAGRYFLLGITPQSISMLAELTEEEISVWMDHQGGRGEVRQGTPFRQAFMDVLQRENKR